MGSWMDVDRSHTYATGDLVELRTSAERGMKNLFRVKSVTGDGDLLLGQLSPDAADEYQGHDTVIPSEDVYEDVFAARTEVLDLYTYTRS